MSEKKDTSKKKDGLTRFPDGLPHSDKLNEILEKAKKKNKLTSAEMMELDKLDLDNDQSDLFYDIVANLGIELVTDEDLTDVVEPTDEIIEEIPEEEIVDPNTPPEPPTYSIPMAVTLPLVGEMATSTAAIIGAALLVVILLLVGFLLGRIGHNGGGYDDDGDSGDDDDRPPQPPRPNRNAAAQNRAPQQSRPEPVKAAPAARLVQQSAPAQPVRKAAPAAPARPQQRKVSDDTLTSPFVEDLSGKMQQEIAQRQAAEASRQAAEAEAARQAAEAANPAAAANEKVGRMSLDELLNDIHNM